MAHLTTSQSQALAQLRDLTNGGDDDVAVGVLSSVEWDVQRAAELIFGTGSNSVPSSSSTNQYRMESFEIDDSRQDEDGIESNRRRPNSTANWAIAPRSIWSLLTLPLHILSGIFRFVFGVLHIPLPQLRFTGLNFYRRPLRAGPSGHGGVDRWVRDLEDETGAVCIGRSKISRSANATGTDAGPSTLTQRSNYSDDDRKLLPDFMLGTYEEMLKRCQTEAKVGCVILVSEEHDDAIEFKRSTLTDTVFVKSLYDNGVIVWGGDVRDQEAWSAAEKLQATTYPFVAFISLQPRRSPTARNQRSSSPSAALTVLSRHQGPCVPATAPTSAQSLIDHLQNQVLPRVSTFLDDIRTARRERERDRHLREEQDRAFRDSARRDKERIEAKVAAERAEREEKQRLEQEAVLEEHKRMLEQEEAQRREALRMDWRRWARRNVVSPENEDPKNTLRIAVRLPTDGRVIRRFAPTATLTALYAFVDAQLVPSVFAPESDPHNPPRGSVSGELAIEQEILRSKASGVDWWEFKLVTSYPRKEVEWKAGSRLCDVDVLRGGGQLVVETVGRRNLPDEAEDGYSTEDSDQ